MRFQCVPRRRAGFLSHARFPVAALFTVAFLLSLRSAAADGQILFDNNRPDVGVLAPVFGVDGVTPVSGPAYLAELRIGLSPSSLEPVGMPLPFGTGAKAGFLNASADAQQGRRILPVAPGTLVYVQVRTWSTLGGATFDEAVANAGAAGLSTIFPVVAGDEAHPAPLLGLDSFKLITDIRASLSFSNLGSGVNAPLLDPEGHPVSGGEVRVQLTAGPAPTDLQPVGTVVQKISNGYFNGGTVRLPGVTSGAYAWAQLRAWHSQDGESFEAARAAGGRVALSQVVRVRTSYIDPFSPPPPPTALAGLQSFRLAAGLPFVGQEPRWLMIEDSPATFEFTAGDADTDPNQLILSATSDSPALIPDAGLAILRDGPRPHLSIVPAANASGTAFISLVAADAQGLRATNVFSVTILPVNDEPSLALPEPPTVLEDAAPLKLTLTLSDPESAAKSIRLQVFSSNPGLIPPAGISLQGTGSTRTVVCTLAPNASGTTTLTFTASDPQDATTSRDLVVTVLPVNDPPTLAQLAEVQLDEDQPGTPFTLPVGDIDNPPGTLAVQATSSDPELLLASSLKPVFVNDAWTLQLIPAQNRNGNASVTVRVTDPAGESVQQQFAVHVRPINDPPTITGPAVITLSEDLPANLPFSVTDVDDTSDQLTVRVESPDTHLLPPASLSLQGTGTERTLRLVPVKDANGEGRVSLVVTDAAGATAKLEVAVTVTPVNDPPVLTAPPSVTLAEDASTGSVACKIEDPETAADLLTLQVTSSNPGLIPASSIRLEGTGAERQVRFTPATNASGTSVLRLVAADPEAATAAVEVNVTVTPINDPPTIEATAEVAADEDQPVAPITVTVSDVDSPLDSISLTASASNPNLLPASALQTTGTGSTRQLQLTPAADQSGTALITLTAIDSEGAQATTVLSLTVRPVNDAPTITLVPPVEIEGTEPSQPLPFQVLDKDNPPEDLRVEVSSSDLELLPLSNVAVEGAGEQRTVVVRPAVNRDGTATVTLTVSDGLGSSRTEFLVTTRAAFSLAGVAQDGYIARGTVFLDLNGNGIPEDGEPATATDDQGRFELSVPLSRYDRNHDGRIGSDEGRLVVVGGQDIATGLSLKVPLSAPPGATVINPLTTLVAALMDRSPDLASGDAATKVKAALGLPETVSLLTFDPLAAAAEEHPGAAGVFSAAAQVHDSILQMSTLVAGATPGADVGEISRSVVDTMAAQIDTAAALSLTDAPSVHSLITQAAAASQSTLSPSIVEGAAVIVAAGNELKQDVAETVANPMEAAREISRVQVVTQSSVSDNLRSVASGQATIDDAVAQDSGTGLEHQVAMAPVASLTARQAEPGTFGFSQGDFEVLENGQAINAVVVNRTAGTQGDVTLTLHLTDGTATRVGGDYTLDSIPVTFADGEIRKTVSLAAALGDDAVPEATETLQLSLELGPDAPPGARLGSTPTATLSVRDDDRPGEFRFTTNRYEVWEDGTPVHEIIIERLNGASGTVTLVVTPGEVRLGARRNVDFVAAPLNVTFAPGHLQHRVRIPIIEDALAEPAENLNLNLSLAQGAPPGATLGTLRSATLVIRDNDAIARPKFRPAATSDSGRVQFRVEADPSFRFAVETSTDLRQWSRLGLYELDADQKLPALVPPQGAGPGLFYRVVQLSD